MKRFINTPLAFAFGMLAMMIPVQAFSAFYSYYYVEKLGLGVGLATLARTIYLIWDAVDQPLFGYFSDHTRTRWGRRKPWIVIAMPLFMLSFVMIFSAPEHLQQTELFTWFLIALILFETFSTIIWVNYGALFPELFRGDKLRAKASAIQQVFQIIALLIGSALTPIIFAAYGFQNMAIIYAMAFSIFMLICVRSVREDEEYRKEQPLKLVAAFKETVPHNSPI